jgi:hypothetical protein
MDLLKNKVDIFLAHDDRSRDLYSYFMDRGKAYTWSTVQDLNFISQFIKTPESKDKVVGINTFDGRANGITGIAVASRHCKNLIQINRGWYDDDRHIFFPNHFGVNVNIIPILSWKKWLQEMSDIYVYLHPMPAASAGRDTITAAALGIPTIGNHHLDAQNRMFPNLGTDPFDPKSMEKSLIRLLQDVDFFNDCRKKGLEAVQYHSIENGEKRAQNILGDFLK